MEILPVSLFAVPELVRAGNQKREATMGTEIVFVIIFPLAIICMATVFLVWFYALKSDHSTPISLVIGFVPLIIGFFISMIILQFLTYTATFEDFTWLVQHGYYTEAQRPVYLPRRVVGNVIVQLVFVLPPICFVVIPCTARLLRTHRLTLWAIGVRAAIGWLALIPIGWLLHRGTIIPPYSLLGSMKSDIVAVLIYGLPIPLTTLWFFHRKWIFRAMLSK
jgi:hypothetical protein